MGRHPQGDHLPCDLRRRGYLQPAEDRSLFPFDMAWIAIILCGIPIILEAVIGLVTAFDIKADVLVSLALIASLCIGETFAAGEVAFIMQLGALLEELTVARLLRNGGEEIIPAGQVQVGDRIRVLPGESVPVDKTVGDTVSSGTVNQFGAFEMEATKVGEDSSIQRMIRLVQSADAGKTPCQACLPLLRDGTILLKDVQGHDPHRVPQLQLTARRQKPGTLFYSVPGFCD